MCKEKLKIVPLLFLLLFSLPSGAKWTDDLTCQINQPCSIRLQTLNGTDIVSGQVCNITILNSSDYPVVNNIAMLNSSTGWQNYSRSFNTSGDYRFTVICSYGGIVLSRSGLIVVKGMIESTAAFPIATLLMALIFGGLAIFLRNKAMQPIKIVFFILCLIMLYFTTNLMARQAEIEGIPEISGIMDGLSIALWWIVFFVLAYILIMFFYEAALVAARKKSGGGYFK